MEANEAVVREDVWIPSACSMCYSNCGILGHRVNGTVVKIEGNPDNPVSAGRICAKGLSSIMTLYDPNRLNFPVKRTNPEKGIGVDPKWQRISWEEALDTIVARMAAAMAKDPRTIVFLRTVADTWSSAFLTSFASAVGTPNLWMSGAGPHCGNGAHAIYGIVHGAFHNQVDYDHCKYLLMFGCGSGAGAHYNATLAMGAISEAKVRGMRMVVVDPMLSPAAERADEWVPIRPGTDGYLALAMLNCLINEYRLYDVEYLASHTNATYLVGDDGRYVRDKGTGKPLAWDAAEKRPKAYDDPSLAKPALLGSYRVDGAQACRPAFQVLADHVKSYRPEDAEKVTTIPAATIRRLAREFGEAAQIGSTIEIDGQTLPHRPAGVLFFKGAQGHKHSFLTAMAIALLSQVVGAADLPGACLGSNPRCQGFPATGRPFWEHKEGPDGLLMAGNWVGGHPPSSYNEPSKPQSMSLGELVPLSHGTGTAFTMLDPEKYELPYKPEVHFIVGSNVVMSLTEVSAIAEALKQVPFTVCYSLYLDEVTEFADVVLPDACFLERYDICSLTHWAGYANSAIIKEWSYYLRQPVSEPLHERRFRNEVMLEIAERLGVTEGLLATFNMLNQLRAPYVLDTQRRYQWTEMIDATLKSYFGPEHDLEWFKEHGVLRWPKKPQESYWRHFTRLRTPIYFEWIPALGAKVEALRKELSYGGEIDTRDYQALPDWKPCPSHEDRSSGFDLFAFYYRVPFHTFSGTYNNAWLDDISNLDPATYALSLNTETARCKGIRDGDWVWIESIYGGRIKGRVLVTEGIHPECIAMANCGGHWSKYLPLASRSGKGACFEELMKLDWKCVDWTVHNFDLCVKVRVERV